jgi:signal transduction histidine kinase
MPFDPMADITEHKLAEEALPSMSRRVIEAEEWESNRIAIDLHEDVGQRLALLAIEIEQLKIAPNKTVEMLSRMDAAWKQTLGILTMPRPPRTSCTLQGWNIST